MNNLKITHAIMEYKHYIGGDSGAECYCGINESSKKSKIEYIDVFSFLHFIKAKNKQYNLCCCCANKIAILCRNFANGKK